MHLQHRWEIEYEEREAIVHCPHEDGIWRIPKCRTCTVCGKHQVVDYGDGWKTVAVSDRRLPAPISEEGTRG